MRLNVLQQWLEDIYRLSLACQVEDFLLTDQALVRNLDRSANPLEIREKLLLHEEGDELGLSLYLDQTVVETLEAEEPAGLLHGNCLSDFLLALEGVSHFVCLIWNISRDRGISLLELEMQAEIDKFVTLSLLMVHYHDSIETALFRSFLFDDQKYHEGLNEAQRSRYIQANHLAGKYCLQLEQRHWRRGDQRPAYELFGELRRFYRLSQTDKIGLIQRQYVPAV